METNPTENDSLLKGQDEGAGKASVPASLFNLANTILGAGTLGIPLAFKLCGVGVAGVLLLLAALEAFASLWMMVRVSEVTPGVSFRLAARKAFRSGKLALVVDGIVALKSVGVITAYFTIIGDLMPPVAKGLFDVDDNGVWASPRLWIALFAFPVLLLAHVRDLRALRFTSALAIGCVVYLCCVVLWYHFATVVKEDVEELKWARWSMVRFFRALPIIVFAFTCHQNLFRIHQELSLPTRKRSVGVIGGAVGMVSVVYFVCGVFGYITFYEATESNILKSYPSESKLVLVGRLAVVILVTLSAPLLSHPGRRSADDLLLSLLRWDHRRNCTMVSFEDQQPGEWLRTRYIGFSTFFCGFPLGIALVRAELSTVLGLTGAVCSVSITYLFPAAFYLGSTASSLGGWGMRFVAWLLVFVGFLCMIISPIAILGDFSE